MLSSPDLSFPGLRTNRAFFTSLLQRQSDCDKNIVLVCLSGGGGVEMANDFSIDVWANVT